MNPLYLRIDHANGYIEEKNRNKYLIFGSTDEDKELLKKDDDVWNVIKNKIKTINVGKENDKISFNDYNYQICFWRRWYPEAFLDDTLYELKTYV